ncbi:MAG: DUF6596 domain-containing protein [Bradyrhizobium sp.]
MGRVLTTVAPLEPETHGLLALMELNASRTAARTDCGGRADPVAGSEPRAVGPASNPPRDAGARACARAQGSRMILCPAGRAGRLSRGGGDG